MDPIEARRDAREAAGLAAALTVRLRVLEESRPAIRLAVDVGDRSLLGSLGDIDVDLAVMLVMMETANAAQDDLRAILAEMQAVNARRARNRQAIEAMKAQRQEVRKEALARGTREPDAVLEVLLTAYGIVVEREVDQLIDDIDSMSEMGEMESLRLQMMMDRITKMMSALSNLMKKLSDTSQQVVQNMK